ncbi:MAG: carbohydrate ABC transporter permease [Sphaerochaetaceae bacterium]
MVKQKTRLTVILNIIYFIILVLLVLYTLFPIIWSLGNSFRTDDSKIFRYVSPLSIYTFIPKNFSLNSYKSLFTRWQFLRPLINSLIVSLSTIILGFVVNGLAGFAFAKYNFKGKNILFSFFLFSFMIPFEMIAIPLYKTVGHMGLLNTRMALILPMISNGMIVFLYSQFFRDIPSALIDSAVIDGAGTLKIFFELITPLSKPVIISASLMTFIQQWDAFLWPLVAASEKKYKVVQVAISEFTGEEKVEWGIILAATIIAIAIPICFLVPLQKYYIQGISSTGLKE